VSYFNQGLFDSFGRRKKRPADLDDALQRAFASGKPAVIDVLIDQNTLAPVVYKA